MPRLLADEAKLAERGIDVVDGRVVAGRSRARRGSRSSPRIETSRSRPIDIVLATGLAYGRPPVPGLERPSSTPSRPGCVALGTSWRAARAGCSSSVPGLIGTETAATLASAGHDVTVVDLLERPLDRLHDPLPALALEALAEAGPGSSAACGSSASSVALQ